MVALVAVKGLAWFAAKGDERSALRCTPDRPESDCSQYVVL